MYFTFKSHLNSGVKFSSKILHLYLDFIKFRVEKADSHIQVAPNVLKDFQITELSKGL